MVMPKETIATGADPTCCGKTLELQVCSSGGGYYLGTQCENCGPYSRESEYFKTREQANTALDLWKQGKTVAQRGNVQS